MAKLKVGTMGKKAKQAKTGVPVGVAAKLSKKSKLSKKTLGSMKESLKPR